MTDADAAAARDRTRRHRAQDLVARKQGRSISLVIPARNEAATIGEIVRRVRRSLVDEVPLLDEVVVIDSDSTDPTAAVAAAAGATVHAATAIRPDLGTHPGKGEALWKSQFVTTGDLVAFMDADLVQWDPHFVTGLLGPLLDDQATALVKAYYRRPLRTATAGHDQAADLNDGGGRVTELVARPLLALGWPQLWHIVQPLAGEWAIRRDALRTLSMPVGYGVDIAALLDVVTRFGPDSVAQVDLGVRAHRHHGHSVLGPMAVQVIAAIERRLCKSATGFCLPAEQRSTVTLTQFRPDPTGSDANGTSDPSGLVAHRLVVQVHERPPAVEVVGYPAVAR